jgi:hypothetical protein
MASNNSSKFGWFRILFYMLIFATGVMYLAGTAALLDIIVNGKWDKIGLPLSLLIPAIALTVVLPRIWSELNKRS